jgi:hypothetical protein
MDVASCSAPTACPFSIMISLGGVYGCSFMLRFASCSASAACPFSIMIPSRGAYRCSFVLRFASCSAPAACLSMQLRTSCLLPRPSIQLCAPALLPRSLRLPRVRGDHCARGYHLRLCPLPCLLMEHLQHKGFVATYVRSR